MVISQQEYEAAIRRADEAEAKLQECLENPLILTQQQSRRDYFTGAALTGLLGNHGRHVGEASVGVIGAEAVALADAAARAAERSSAANHAPDRPPLPDVADYVADAAKLVIEGMTSEGTAAAADNGVKLRELFERVQSEAIEAARGEP